MPKGLSDKEIKRITEEVMRCCKPKISDSLGQYLACLSNPFDCECTGAPFLPSKVSYKYKVKSRGFVTIGTAGIGFIGVAPLRTQLNNAESVYFSNGSFAGSNALKTGTGVEAEMMPGPYAGTALGQDLSTRLVACGIKLFYTGKELDRAGAIVGRVHPDRQDLSGASITDLLEDQSVVALPAQRKSACLVWTPIMAREYEYESSTANVTDTMSMLVMIQGTPGSSYFFEVAACVECVGSMVPSVTKSNADPIATAVAGDVVQNIDGNHLIWDAAASFKRMVTAAQAAVEGILGFDNGWTGPTSHLLMKGARAAAGSVLYTGAFSSGRRLKAIKPKGAGNGKFSDGSVSDDGPGGSENFEDIHERIDVAQQRVEAISHEIRATRDNARRSQLSDERTRIEAAMFRDRQILERDTQHDEL